MARINSARLVAQAADYALRADTVRKDPAVAKAAKQASKDMTRAARSIAELAQETGHAWRRSATA